jgi:hypothetical protein
MHAVSSGKRDVIVPLLARGGDTKYDTLDGFGALDLCSTLERASPGNESTEAAGAPP